MQNVSQFVFFKPLTFFFFFKFGKHRSIAEIVHYAAGGAGCQQTANTHSEETETQQVWSNTAFVCASEAATLPISQP